MTASRRVNRSLKRRLSELICAAANAGLTGALHSIATYRVAFERRRDLLADAISGLSPDARGGPVSALIGFSPDQHRPRVLALWVSCGDLSHPTTRAIDTPITGVLASAAPPTMTEPRRTMPPPAPLTIGPRTMLSSYGLQSRSPAFSLFLSNFNFDHFQNTAIA